MAKKIRLSPSQLAEMKAEFQNLKTMDGYESHKPDFEVAAIQAVDTSIDALLAQEAQVKNQLASISDQIADKGREYIDKMNGAAQQVVAKFGDDSAEYQSLGRKRKSERRTRRPKSGGGDMPNG